MIYEPSFVTPNNTTIDVSDPESTFSFMLNCDGGTPVAGLQLTVRDTFSGGNIYGTYVANNNNGIQNGTIVEAKIKNFISGNTMVNGNNYSFNIYMYNDYYDIFYGSGAISDNSNNTTTSFYLTEDSYISKDSYIDIRGEKRKVTSYDASSRLCIVNPPFSFTPRNEPFSKYSNNIETGLYYFKARKTPTLSIYNKDLSVIPPVINNKEYTFVGKYEQEQSTPWSFYKWELYNSNNMLIDNTDWINSSGLKYSFDGFTNGQSYYVKLYVQNADNIIVEKKSNIFNVSYDDILISSTVSASLLCDKNAVNVSWGSPMINSIKMDGNSDKYSYLDNTPADGHTSISINGAIMRSYLMNAQQSFDMPYNSTFVLLCRLDKSINSIFSLYRDDGSYRSVSIYTNIGYKYAVYKEYNNGEITEIDRLLLPDSLEIGDWVKVFIYPNRVQVYLYKQAPALNCFAPPNTIMTSPTRLFSDYKLITTDVLYK